MSTLASAVVAWDRGVAEATVWVPGGVPLGGRGPRKGRGLHPARRNATVCLPTGAPGRIATRRLAGAAVVLALLLTTPPPTSAAQPPDMQRAIAQIDRLKGAILVDDDDPARPVIGVNLNCSANVVDATLAHLRAFPRLRVLRLNFTGVTDDGLAHLKGLTELRELTLDYTQVTDLGLVHLRGLPRLQSLSLSHTPAENRGWEVFQSLRKGEPPAPEVCEAIAEVRKLGGTVVIDYQVPRWAVLEVDLSGSTKVVDASLARLRAFPGLHALRLSSTGVTDAGLAHLKGLTELRELTLDSTGISDTGLAHLKGLSNLKSLSLCQTAVGDRGLEALQSLKNLRDLDLTETQTTDRGTRALLAALPELKKSPAHYLYSGQLARGEQELKAALEASPRDGQLRFGLGVLQFVRAVERLGQALHRYGCRSDNTNLPFLRLPVPRNPDPALITYAAFRGFLDDLRRDLAVAEATLAGVTDDNVKLRLRLARFRLDLDGDGKPTDRLLDILQRVMGPQIRFPKDNPDFLVCFDRGDVAWLRAYCHLLMGMLDSYLAFDTETLFDLTAGDLFDRPKQRFQGAEAERQQKLTEAGKVIAVKEPARLGEFRKHLLKVAELNRETWKYIRAETDDDHEWLPNPRQRGVLGLPVRDEMIDAWLDVMAELEALLNGDKVLAMPFGNPEKDGKGLNLKTLLERPPAEFRIADPGTWLPARYWDSKPGADFGKLLRVIRVFESPSAVAYAMWFN